MLKSCDAVCQLCATHMACACYLLARCLTSITKQLLRKYQAFILNVWYLLDHCLSDALCCLASDLQGVGRKYQANGSLPLNSLAGLVVHNLLVANLNSGLPHPMLRSEIPIRKFSLSKCMNDFKRTSYLYWYFLSDIIYTCRCLCKTASCLNRGKSLMYMYFTHGYYFIHKLHIEWEFIFLAF